MENNKQNTNINSSKNTRSLSSDSQYGLNTRSLSSNPQYGLNTRSLFSNPQYGLNTPPLSSNYQCGINIRSLYSNPQYGLNTPPLSSNPQHGINIRSLSSNPQYGLNTRPFSSNLQYGLNTPPLSSNPQYGINIRSLSSNPQYGLNTRPLSSNPQYGLNTPPLSSNPQYGLNTRPLSSNPQYDLNTRPLSSNPQYGLNIHPLSSNHQYGQNTRPLSSNSQYGLNTRPLYSNTQYGLNTPSSNTSLVERVPSATTTKTSAHPMRGQTSLQNQNKREVPPNLEKTESKKMRKDLDPGSNSFVAWSPGSRESEVAKKAYPTRRNKSSTTNDKAPINLNTNGHSRQNDSGRANVTIVVDQSPAGSNLNSSLQIVDFERTKSLENVEEKIFKPVKDEEYQTLEEGELIPSFENFKVIVNGYNIGPALGDDIRAKYFDLCFSQGQYLHAQLLKLISFQLAVQIISTIVEISEWMRNCNLRSILDDFEERRNVLRAFEKFGMEVGFLINRINTIHGIVFASTTEVDLEKRRKAKTERVRTEEKKNELQKEMVEVEKEMVEVEQKMVKLDSEIQTIEEIADRYEVKIRKEATAPW